MRYSFSGHESFPCKTLWLKKGVDFIDQGYSFNSEDAVATLGVGKNMVSAIRYWLKAFGLSENDELTELAKYLFLPTKEADPYAEDISTLWLLHYTLVRKNVASLYSLLFTEFQREKKEFDKEQLNLFVKRKCQTPEQKSAYNENTVRKDIRVLLQNYVMPTNKNSIEDFSALLISLNLIQENKDKYVFSEMNKDSICPDIIMYALIDIKGEDMTLSLDTLQELSLIFCLPINELISIIKTLEQWYQGVLTYTDNSGIKNVQFLKEIDKYKILDRYYE